MQGGSPGYENLGLGGPRFRRVSFLTPRKRIGPVLTRSFLLGNFTRPMFLRAMESLGLHCTSNRVLLPLSLGPKKI